MISNPQYVVCTAIPENRTKPLSLERALEVAQGILDDTNNFASAFNWPPIEKIDDMRWRLWNGACYRDTWIEVC